MSRYTEKSIAIEAVKAVEEYGELSMTEMISVLTERMKPSGHDAEISKKRSDSYFSQKVRNLRSHNNKIFFGKVYFDEEKEKYVSTECKVLKETLSKTKYDAEIKKRQNRVTQFYAKKLDFELINKERKLIGDAGEVFVYKEQVEFVVKYAPEYKGSVRHVSKLDGDGAGYDILSFDEMKNIVYIEVKSTTKKKETPFYMSASEYAFFEMHKEAYVIARVYEFDISAQKGKVEYIRGADVESVFEKEVSAYKVYYR